MSEYTAEDFEQAMFAVHPDPDAVDARYAARMNRDPEYPWLLDGVPGNGDEHMARDGWVPVVESRVTDHTLRRVEERAERKREKLVEHIADQDRVIRRRNDEITALRRELADAQAPLSLDTLAAAWEAAEVPTDDAPIREGDTVIQSAGRGHFYVFQETINWVAAPDSGFVRILSRAPKREPWADLGDKLAVEMPGIEDEPRIEALAKALYCEHGVRVTGGDEK